MTREEAQKHIILSLVTGSHAYGLNGPTSDVDRKVVVVEPIEAVAGLASPWDGAVYGQDGKEDFEMYGLRKFIRLALKGNPTVTEMLFITPEEATRTDFMRGDSRGRRLQELAPQIVSKRAGAAYLGYMQAQRLRMTGERGNGGHGKPRRDVISQEVGFDTKFAMHMLRLGYQGVELLTTGHLELPIGAYHRAFLLSVRQGEVPLEDCLIRAQELEAAVKDALAHSKLQDEPKTAEVEAWMLKTYLMQWKALQNLENINDMAEGYKKLVRRQAAMHRVRPRLP